MKIPVNEPIVSSLAIEYVNQALKSGFISSVGEFVEKFEKEFSSYLGVKYSTTCSNGTTALHLALSALDIGSGDEIIIPNLTIISCALAAIYTGATPVLVDVELDTGNIDTQKIEAAITKQTKAIMVVHLYGHPVNMDPVIKLAKKYNLKIIEDAAEAHGAQYFSKLTKKWHKVGSLGDIGVFSFYANKIITTGEGGMVVTNNLKIYNRVQSLKNLSHKKDKRFFHEEIGFNYRMTNLQAAMGPNSKWKCTTKV